MRDPEHQRCNCHGQNDPDPSVSDKINYSDLQVSSINDLFAKSCQSPSCKEQEQEAAVVALQVLECAEVLSEDYPPVRLKWKYLRNTSRWLYSIGPGEIMPRCWNCSAEVPEQATFCPACGKTFAVTSPSSPQPAQPYAQVPPSNNQQYPMNPYPSREFEMERKINSIYKIVTVLLILQVGFMLLVFL